MKHRYRAVQEGNDDFFGDWRIQRRPIWWPFWSYTGLVLKTISAQVYCDSMNKENS